VVEIPEVHRATTFAALAAYLARGSVGGGALGTDNGIDLTTIDLCGDCYNLVAERDCGASDLGTSRLAPPPPACPHRLILAHPLATTRFCYISCMQRY
jgi:hypothetical protein